jgi:hypothetical protein
MMAAAQQQHGPDLSLHPDAEKKKRMRACEWRQLIFLSEKKKKKKKSEPRQRSSSSRCRALLAHHGITEHSSEEKRSSRERLSHGRAYIKKRAKGFEPWSI